METVYFNLFDEKHLSGQFAACIGYFDGLHRGHKALIDKTVELARKRELKSAVITFYPDPYEVINHVAQKHILDLDSRLKILETWGIEYCLVFNFDELLMKKTADEFLDMLLARVDIRAMVCGFDFTYAYQKQGNVETLREDGEGLFSLDVIDEVSYRQEKIASSRIRQALSDGDIPLVNELLGYDYFIKGQVIHGLGNGHKLGFPTANILFDKELLLPKPQVYEGYCKVKNHYYQAMINYGANPSIKKAGPLTLETHLIDYDGDLYDEEVYLYFKEALRPEMVFASMEELTAQLFKDEKQVKENMKHGNFIL